MTSLKYFSSRIELITRYVPITKRSEKKNVLKVSVLKVLVLINEKCLLTFTCSKSTIETLEKGVEYAQS